MLTTSRVHFEGPPGLQRRGVHEDRHSAHFISNIYIYIYPECMRMREHCRGSTVFVIEHTYNVWSIGTCGSVWHLHGDIADEHLYVPPSLCENH